MHMLPPMIADLHKYMRQLPKAGAMLLVFFLAACSSYDYNPQTGGLFETKNSPLPVPRPRIKPQPPFRQSELVHKVAPKQALSVKGWSVKVKKDDTVYGLSKRFGIQVKDLIRHNRLKPPYVLSVGQNLSLPKINYYVVKRGDTGTNIAKRHGVQVSTLMRINNIRKPYMLSVGQKLKLPGGASRAAPDIAKNKAGGTKTVAVQKKNLAAPPRSGNGFSWPIKGKILSAYGPKSEGQKNEGINIAGKLGAPVRAAQSGVVVYANNGIDGYGNLLLIKHSGGWMTAYAHNERLLVTTGQKIARGQIIARVGKSGGAKVPQLHFEIRKGRQTYDPAKYLR